MLEPVPCSVCQTVPELPRDVYEASDGARICCSFCGSCGAPHDGFLHLSQLVLAHVVRNWNRTHGHTPTG